MHHYFFHMLSHQIFSGNLVHIGKNAFIKFETLIYFGFCAMPNQKWNIFQKSINCATLWSPFSNVGRCLEISNFCHIITSTCFQIIREVQLCFSTVKWFLDLLNTCIFGKNHMQNLPSNHHSNNEFCVWTILILIVKGFSKLFFVIFAPV